MFMRCRAVPCAILRVYQRLPPILAPQQLAANLTYLCPPLDLRTLHILPAHRSIASKLEGTPRGCGGADACAEHASRVPLK